MIDKELLIMAAKAAGLVDIHERAGKICYTSNGGHGGSVMWNSLTDDGDALRLAVKLDLHVVFHPALAQAIVRPYYCAEGEGETIENIENNSDRYAATRRAIVRAAADIGSKL